MTARAKATATAQTAPPPKLTVRDWASVTLFVIVYLGFLALLAIPTIFLAFVVLKLAYIIIYSVLMW